MRDYLLIGITVGIFMVSLRLPLLLTELQYGLIQTKISIGLIVWCIILYVVYVIRLYNKTKEAKQYEL